MTTKYQWHDVYKAAVLETDWSKMEERILAAEFAIHEGRKRFPRTMAAPLRKDKLLQTL